MMSKQSHLWSPLRAGPVFWSRFFAAVALLVLLGGCERGGALRITAEVDEPHYRRGVQMARSGQNQLALEAFLKVIDKRGGDAPESHLEAGQIYLNHIKDYIAAIYHYRKYLELRPNSPQERQVRQLIETAMKQFATTLAGEPLGPQMERLDLMDALEKLKAENSSLRAEMTKMGRQPSAPAVVTQSWGAEPMRSSRAQRGDAFNDPFASQRDMPLIPINRPVVAETRDRPPAAPPVATVNPPRSAGRTYTVQPKDTLYGISVKFYGSGNRWQSIMQANNDVLGSSAELKVGMVLRIP